MSLHFSLIKWNSLGQFADTFLINERNKVTNLAGRMTRCDGGLHPIVGMTRHEPNCCDVIADQTHALRSACSFMHMNTTNNRAKPSYVASTTWFQIALGKSNVLFEAQVVLQFLHLSFSAKLEHCFNFGIRFCHKTLWCITLTSGIFLEFILLSIVLVST